MPDIAAARPAAGAVVESSWGQQVHDQVEGVQAGKASCSISASTAGTIVPVTFPRAYLVAPIVVAAVMQGAGVWAVATAVTTTGLSLQLRAAASTTTTVDVGWVAIGTPA